MTELARYTLKDVAKKDGRDGAETWLVIRDMVYDVTKYKDEVWVLETIVVLKSMITWYLIIRLSVD